MTFDPRKEARDEAVRLGQQLAKLSDEVDALEITATDKIQLALDLIDEAIDILGGEDEA